MARRDLAAVTRRPARAAATVVTLLTATGLVACGSTRHVVTIPAQKTTSTASTPIHTPTETAPALSKTSTVLPPRRAATNPAPPSHKSAASLLAAIKPPIVWDPIPFGPERKAQMAAYAVRHYGLDTYRLVDPHVIVIHYTVTPDFQSTYNTFAPDTTDPELHELPNTCAHFVIDGAGVIHQLVSLDIMCRHTVGLNWTAIGIEHVGDSDQQVLDNPRQMSASLRLVRWLRCRFQIPIRDVIGHNESLTSPYHHENVPSLRTQTHSDFMRADMEIYRHRLGALGACPV